MHHTTDNQDLLLDLILAGFFLPYLLATFLRKIKELKFCICILRACRFASNFLNKRTIAIAMSSTLNLIHPNTHTFAWLIFFLWFQFLNACPPGRSFYERFYFHSLTSPLLLLDCKNLNVDCLNCRYIVCRNIFHSLTSTYSGWSFLA